MDPATTVARDDAPIQLKEYLGILRLRKWSIVLVTVLLVGAALGVSFLQTPLYEAEAKLLVNPQALAPGQTLPAGVAPNLDTERGVASSEGVADVVIDELGLQESPDELLEGLSVSVEVNTAILVFTYSHPDPQEAQRRTQGFAEGYRQFRREQILDELLASTQSIRQRMARLQSELEEINADIAATDEPAERASLQAGANSIVSEVTVLQQQLSEVSSSGTLDVAQVVDPADIPEAPSSPSFPRNVALGLVLGLALGVGQAFLRERLDDSLRGRADLEENIGAPVLAVIPKVPGWRQRSEAKLITLSEPGSATSEAFRTLRTGFIFSAMQRGAKVILVTSPNPGEGKSATTSNLGVALAQAGRQVALVSADLRRPRLHKFLGVHGGVGLTEVLTGEWTPDQGLPSSEVQNLHVIPSGAIPGNPAELLGSDRMGTVLNQLRSILDFVLIDAPPVLAVADAMTLTPFADGVLFVADAEATSRSAVAHARIQLEQVNASIIGAVLNNFDPSKARLYQPYHGGYYGYRYEAQPAPVGGNGRGGLLRRRRRVRSAAAPPQPPPRQGVPR
ncbi:MAG: polysaccharide biosynthesis tyrosine autokinase, partial [Actinomycetota bacterium]